LGCDHIKLPAKLLDCFLRSFQSNIHQIYAYLWKQKNDKRGLVPGKYTKISNLKAKGHVFNNTMRKKEITALVSVPTVYFKKLPRSSLYLLPTTLQCPAKARKYRKRVQPLFPTTG